MARITRIPSQRFSAPSAVQHLWVCRAGARNLDSLGRTLAFASDPGTHEEGRNAGKQEQRQPPQAFSFPAFLIFVPWHASPHEVRTGGMTKTYHGKEPKIIAPREEMKRSLYRSTQMSCSRVFFIRVQSNNNRTDLASPFGIRPNLL